MHPSAALRVLLLGATLPPLHTLHTLPAQNLPTAADITACLDRARPALHQHLRQAKGDVLALVCLAALHDKLPPSDESLARALQRLDRTVLNGTYGAALRLMVLAEDPAAFGALPADELAERVERDSRRILQNRYRGGFTYAKRNPYWDLSNTQYAALGLRAATSLGFVVPPDIWKNMLRTVLDVQASTGGFGYTRDQRRKRAYSSMTVAGIAIMQVCIQHLSAADLAGLDLDKALRHAWRWMDDHHVDVGSERALSCLYFHYGLERAAILSDVDKVGNRDWYKAGAAMLLRMQDGKDGSWRSSWEIRPGALPGPGSPVDTSFAVLFLRRNFKKSLPARYVRLTNLGVQATRTEVEVAAKRSIAQGRDALPEVIKALRSAVRPQRDAAALALRGLAGRDFGYDPRPEPAASADAIKAAERWWLTEGASRKR